MTKGHFVVYDKPGCMHCKMLLKYLEGHHFKTVTNYYDDEDKTNSIDVDSANAAKASWSQQKLDKFRDEGLAAMPVVRVYNDENNELVETFTGFNVSEIMKLTKEFDFSA